jgi:sporulenol synthase
LRRRLQSAQSTLIGHLQKLQKDDGSWNFCFENSLMTDANMIILLSSLGVNDKELIGRLNSRVLNLQTEEGAWKLFSDEKDGNLSATVEAYFALAYSKALDMNDPRMIKARRFIKNNGGIDNAHSLTKFMLAANGQYDWDRFFPVPIELLLLPKSFIVNFWDFSGHARVHMTPLMILKNRKYKRIKRNTPNIRDLLVRQSTADVPTIETRSLISTIKQGIQSLYQLPQYLENEAIHTAHHYMLQRIEKDGTYYSYFSSTFFMIYALLALGYKKTDPIIIKAISALKKMICQTEEGSHIQNSTSTIWDTALITHSLQNAGVSYKDETIKKAVHFLLKKQQMRYGDWAMEVPKIAPGGWGFSHNNTMNPDVDDTTAALRAITSTAASEPTSRHAWNRGVEWLWKMQNRDGGWPAFEPNKTKEILSSFPIDGAEAVSIDPSTADLTGRTLEFLGKKAGVTGDHPSISRAIQWLKGHQEEDGSWYGRWGICYIYGTWAAVTGMRAVGVPANDKSLQKAKQWLISIQNRDGGWGESCYSDQKKKYIPLQHSTPSQTAWALDALISLSDKPNHVINKGIESLLGQLEKKDWTSTYPTGAGLPGNFYIHYHSYRWIWPLLTISHYNAKYKPNT